MNPAPLLPPVSGTVVITEWVPGESLPSTSGGVTGLLLPYNTVVGPMTKGFPRAETTVHEWIPGISTPEGLILSGVATAAVVVASNPQLFERVVSGASTFLVVGVTATVPAATVLFGTTLT